MAAKTYPPVSVHPENPKLSLFRGNPLVLVTATEHYGSVINRPFRFELYLEDAAERGMTMTRLFLLFRELQSPLNPYSTCKPESVDYVAPYPRTGPGKALDGQPRFDLTRWNPEFFERLDRFLSIASSLGIVVELTLFSNTYGPQIWALNPLHPDNNLDAWPPVMWHEYTSRRHDALFARQAAFVREVVDRTMRYDNIIYELCNEPGANAAPGSPTPEEVNEWMGEIASIIRETEASLPQGHLIAGSEAFAYHIEDESRRSGPDVFQAADLSFSDLPIDIVNMHPLSNMVYRGRYYNMGQFMQAEMRLAEFQRYCLDTYGEGKPLNLDEDNCATQYRDDRGWTIHRKRAWTALFCGAHYDMIDFSIAVHAETGTDASRKAIRSWIGHLAKFIHALDLVAARPRPELLLKAPPGIVGSVLADEGAEYVLYLADSRENGDEDVKEIVRGRIAVKLPDKRFVVSCYSPITGQESPAVPLSGVDSGNPARGIELQLPPFRHDLVVRIRR